MSSPLETYTPDADDAQGLTRTFPAAQEPPFPAAHPRFPTAQFNYKPICDEILALISRAYGRNKFGATITETITTDTHNFNPTGLSSSTWILLAGSVDDLDLTGVEAGEHGDLLVITNNSGNLINLKHDNAGSDLENRFFLCSGFDQVLATHDSVMLAYDAVSAFRWRLINRMCTYPPCNVA